MNSGTVRDQTGAETDYIRKGAALIVVAALLAFVVCQFNGADTLWEGFDLSYLIWLIIDWYEALRWMKSGYGSINFG